VHAFSEASHLDSFAIHAGDAQGILKGTRLDEVASLEMKGIQFLPGTLTTHQTSDELTMVAQDGAAAAALKQGDVASAKATLKDGRVFSLNTLVAAPRPSVKLLGKSIEPSTAATNSNIELTNQDELPQDSRVTFSVRAVSPAVFAYDQKIEVATADETFSTTLTLTNGGMTLENSKVAVATFDPGKAFGGSAFGPLQFRVVTAAGVPGDWQKLGTLVRLPVLKELKCPSTPDIACKLSGSNLFLVDSISNDPGFAHPVQVPDGFPGYTMPVPHPSGGTLYVKLRDDPTVVNSTGLGAQELPATSDEAARAPERHAAHSDPEPAPPAPKPDDATKSAVATSSSSQSTSAQPNPAVAPTASTPVATPTSAPATAPSVTPTSAPATASGLAAAPTSTLAPPPPPPATALPVPTVAPAPTATASTVGSAGR
jgi:hypothetical protein